MTTTTALGHRIDKRTRTSDGTETCRYCGDIIPEGEQYQQETVSIAGKNVEVSVCAPCLKARPAGDWCAAITIGGAVVITLSVAAAVFGG
jgi:hypothetical protein